MKKFWCCLLTVVAVMMSGCGYHWGQLTNPRLGNPAFEVKNCTEYPNLSRWTRKHFHRDLFQQSGLKVTTPAEADTLVIAEVISANFTTATTRRVTEEEWDDRSRRTDDATSTSSYRGIVKIRFKVVENTDEQAVIIPETLVEGVAIAPVTPDVTLAQQVAFEAAIQQATQQMINEISEAW